MISNLNDYEDFIYLYLSSSIGKDVAHNHYSEGIDEIKHQGMSWGNAYSQNIRLEKFGNKKI